MMTSSVEDNWPWEFGSHPRRSASGDTKTKKPKAEQETAQPTAARFNKYGHSELYQDQIFSYTIYLYNRKFDWCSIADPI